VYYHVFTGEETAAVAFGAMLRALPPAVPAYGIIEADEPEDRLPLAVNCNGSTGKAYLAGEARTIQLLRRHLVTERGWPRQAVRTKPFWTPGRRGLD
jgi:NADPH-dependent ferric siderophore reductase